MSRMFAFMSAVVTVQGSVGMFVVYVTYQAYCRQVHKYDIFMSIVTCVSSMSRASYRYIIDKPLFLALPAFFRVFLLTLLSLLHWVSAAFLEQLGEVNTSELGKVRFFVARLVRGVDVIKLSSVGFN